MTSRTIKQSLKDGKVPREAVRAAVRGAPQWYIDMLINKDGKYTLKDIEGAKSWRDIMND